MGSNAFLHIIVFILTGSHFLVIQLAVIDFFLKQTLPFLSIAVAIPTIATLGLTIISSISQLKISDNQFIQKTLFGSLKFPIRDLTFYQEDRRLYILKRGHQLNITPALLSDNVKNKIKTKPFSIDKRKIIAFYLVFQILMLIVLASLGFFRIEFVGTSFFMSLILTLDLRIYRWSWFIKK